jgi:glycosyltransferase involved in cell wall biosynthesis
MSALRYSIIIPTYNRANELARCISAIGSVAFSRERFEVLVVNDGGARPDVNQLQDLAPGIRIEVISQRNRGPATARNSGARSARGDYLAFVDDDCIPPADWLVNLDSIATANPDALIGGRTVNALPDSLCSQASQTLVDYVYSYYNVSEGGRNAFFASNNMSMPSAAFRMLGGFDETFRTAEDRELCSRWIANGGRLLYAPEVIMLHAHDLDLISLHRQHFGYGRGALSYWRKMAARRMRGFRVEPLSFYAGMLAFPFRQGDSNALLVSALIAYSQLSNAAGFAAEVVRRKNAAPRRAPARDTKAASEAGLT